MLESEVQYSWAELKFRLENLKRRQAEQPNKDRAIMIEKLQYAVDSGLNNIPSINDIREARGTPRRKKRKKRQNQDEVIWI